MNQRHVDHSKCFFQCLFPVLPLCACKTFIEIGRDFRKCVDSFKFRLEIDGFFFFILLLASLRRGIFDLFRCLLSSEKPFLLGHWFVLDRFEQLLEICLLDGLEIGPEKRLHGLAKPSVQFNCECLSLGTHVLVRMTINLGEQLENRLGFDSLAAVCVVDFLESAEGGCDDLGQFVREQGQEFFEHRV